MLEQTQISVKKPVLVVGAHASGKSYWLDRLRENAPRVWASRKAEPLYLAAVRPLSAWTDTKPLELWWASRQSDDTRHWTKLKAWERVDALPLYLKETGAVLFVDDADELSGRKLKLVQDCVRACSVFVMTTADENRISPSLRKDVLGQQPQTFRLNTDIAYDATPLFMWFLIASALAAGAYELALILGGLKMLGSGKRATKQA